MKKVKQAIADELLPWFSQNKRSMPWRSNRTPYRVWISELMLQQTRVDQATPYFQRFMKRFPSLKSLAAASQEEVLKQWEGLGYYSRARNLHKAAQIVAAEHKGRFPDTAEGLIQLPGIGNYTAAAIGSLAFNLDLAVLDGNVIRVLARLFAYTRDSRSSTAKAELQRYADDLLVKGDAGNFNEAMMELGATVCLPRNPQCAQCPLSRVCLGHESGRPTDYPVKAPKKRCRTSSWEPRSSPTRRDRCWLRNVARRICSVVYGNSPAASRNPAKPFNSASNASSRKNWGSMRRPAPSW